MLAGIRKRLARKQLDIKECEDDDKDDLHATAFVPPTNYIKISQGKIQLVHQPPPPTSTPSTLLPPPPSSSSPPPPPFNTHSHSHHICNGLESPKDKQDKLENRIIELEAALLRLQEKVNNSQCGSPTFEKELRQQLENMSRVIKSKERKQLQTCRDHKALQTRFARQENLLHTLQQENKALLLRVRQYEHCLDDVMRKVVDAIVAEDNLREEVALLKGRVRDLEAQNAALSASPAKGRDEGYCTMSSGQPQPSNGHLEDLPEEPEQWLLPAEPCSTEMEDWSMSQEELAVITLDEERHQQQRENGRRQQKLSDHDWIWNSTDLLNSTMVETDSVGDNISQLLQQKIIYSEDEEVACTEFTNDFYKLVNIRSSSARSLYSYIEGDTDDEDDDEDDDDDSEDDDDEEGEEDDGNSSLSPSHKRLRSKVLKSRQKQPSPTPSEAGRAQVTSCSSSETDDFSHCTTTTINTNHQEIPLQTLKENEIMNENFPITNQAEEEQEEDHTLDQHSDIEIEDVQLDGDLQTPNIIMNHTNHQRHLSEPMSEKECIEQIIKTELSRAPRHKLMKSQSTIEERDSNNILRNRIGQQTDKLPPAVVRSGSVNGNLVTKANRYQERLQNSNNSWRRSNGWKRVISPSQSPTVASPKKDSKSSDLKSPPKCTPTRIPSCKPASISPNQQLPHLKNSTQLQNSNSQQSTRKSKIPPPVPVRRSYAS